MKHLAILPALALLAACATPQEQCINTATNEVRAINSAISTAKGNIARGYAIHRSTQSFEVPTVCYDAEKKPYKCYEFDTRTVETPVSINVAEERRKLASLQKRMPAATRKMKAGVASCRAQFPE